MSRRTAVSKYIRLRMKRPVFAERALSEVERHLGEVDEEMTKAAKILRSPLALDEKTRKGASVAIEGLQRKKGFLRVEQSRLATAILTVPPSKEVLRKEFLDLRAIPSAYAVWVAGTCVNLCVHARLPLNGHVYNLGDWRLILDLSKDTLETFEIRSGRTDEGRQNSYFKLRQYSWDWGFCFGRNLDLVKGLVLQGDYVTAMRVASTYMNGVNRDHLKDVPRIYREVS